MSSPRKNGAPTIRDIAQACGVSEATVSYVINGKYSLKASTRERVWKVMREMNYHPSAVARSMSSKRLHTIGVFSGAVDPVYFISNPYAGGILQGVVAEAQRWAFNVTLFTAQWESAAVSSSALRDGRTDGILVVAPQIDKDIMSGIASLNMPLVAISAEPMEGVPVIDVDNEMGLRLATRHLLDLGHRRIAFLMGDNDLSSFAPRLNGFKRAHQEFGVPHVPEFILESGFWGGHASAQTQELLRHPHPPTALVAGNDRIAAAAIEGAKEAGLSVPDDFSIVGFDDSDLALTTAPNLTTVRQPLVEIGRMAANLLIRRVSDPEPSTETEVTLLAPELIVRHSTGPGGELKAAAESCPLD